MGQWKARRSQRRGHVAEYDQDESIHVSSMATRVKATQNLYVLPVEPKIGRAMPSPLIVHSSLSAKLFSSRMMLSAPDLYPPPNINAC